MKGGLVSYQLPELVPTIIVYQYNPEEVTRQLRLGQEGGYGYGGRGDAYRVNGPPEEAISFTVDIDAADQLGPPNQRAITAANGLHPIIAALEGLLYPPYPVVMANEGLASTGSAFIQAERAPLVLLVWGKRRVLPVQIDSLSIREQAFDANLNPIRVQVDIQATVQSYRDLDPTNPGYWVYMTAFTQKEVMAALSSLSNSTAFQQVLPF